VNTKYPRDFLSVGTETCRFVKTNGPLNWFLIVASFLYLIPKEQAYIIRLNELKDDLFNQHPAKC
jgi:hypothetical protein